MRLADAIAKIDRQGLRRFGLVLGTAMATVFGLFLPWLFDARYPAWPWLFLAIAGAVALLAPQWLAGIYRAWMYFGLLLNRITSPLVLGLLFYAVITPTGLIRRFMNKDPIAKRPDPALDSYRVPADPAAHSDLERPF